MAILHGEQALTFAERVEEEDRKEELDKLHPAT